MLLNKISKISINTNYTANEIYTIIRSIYNNTVLLESLNGPKAMVGQSVICFDPIVYIRIENKKLYYNGIPQTNLLNSIFDFLTSILLEYQIENASKNKFQGGLIGYMGYDIINYIEPHLLEHKREGEENFPDAVLGLFLDGIIFDYEEQSVYYFYHEKHNNRFNLIKNIITSEIPVIKQFNIESNLNMTQSKEEFEEKVNHIKSLIVQGEIFQAVLSQQASCTFSGDRYKIYEELSKLNPSPYMYVIEFFDLFIIGSSPELLLSLQGNKLTTYPIAGTRKVGKNSDETVKISQELLKDEKEIAEHNMLVDLARNDLGKVSKIGSVKVPYYMEVHKFSHVIHIVSKVESTLLSHLNQFDAFQSVFPAGTVTGAPKLRAIEIINQLEPVFRGPYAGSVGYFGLDGNMVQAITIRTAFGIGNNLNIQAGAGIVLDSIPESEYYETVNKFGVFLQILEEDIKT
jgi:anthranilate synthase component I